MEKLKGYNFGLGMSEQSPISSIVEGRLVPRDLTKFDDRQGSKIDNYIYVDANGTPTKMPLQQITSGLIKVVVSEPESADAGEIIFKEID